MESNLSLHLRMFNEKVKLMNQTNSKTLILSAQEARNIQSDMFDLLSYCSQLGSKVTNSSEVITVQVDGGKFK